MKKIQFGAWGFKISLLPSVAFLCLLPLLISLGFWQLDRAEQKQALLALQEQRMHANPVSLIEANAGNIEALRYRQVTVTGRYDAAHQFLIDNQIVNGRAGYYVLTPLQFHNSAQAVLVNRGWIAANFNRAVLPDVTISGDEVTVIGRVNRFPAVGIKLAGAEIPGDGWPSLVQVVDSAALAQRLGYALCDFQVELDPAQPDGYVREWSTATPVPPEKHRAYALQWFGLALTLVILFVWLGFKHNTDE